MGSKKTEGKKAGHAQQQKVGNAKQNRRREMQHPIRSHWMLRLSPQSYINSKQQAAKQALQGKHNNSKQQNKRCKANSTATATRPPEARPRSPRTSNFLTPVPVIMPPPSRYVLAVPSESFSAYFRLVRTFAPFITAMRRL